MGLIGGIARTAVAAGTWTAVSNRVSRYQAGRWAAQDQSQPQPTHGYMPPPPGRYQRAMYQPGYGAPPPSYQAPPTYPPPAPSAAPPADDLTTRLAQIKQLGELKERGVLTDAEFQTQKRKILGD
jgi:hypothetical protein